MLYSCVKKVYKDEKVVGNKSSDVSRHIWSKLYRTLMMPLNGMNMVMGELRCVIFATGAKATKSFTYDKQNRTDLCQSYDRILHQFLHELTKKKKPCI